MVEVEEKNGGYEVILHIKPNHTLEEFTEEFGFSKRAVDDRYMETHNRN